MPPPKSTSADGTSMSKTPKTGEIASGGFPPLNSYGKSLSGGSLRTGQACDRCKLRKIRCDDTNGGCLPCRQNNTECKTTDRITLRATVRGHTEAIERDNHILRQQIVDLEQQLRELGVEPKLTSQYTPARPSLSHDWSQVSSGGQWANESANSNESSLAYTGQGADTQESRSQETNVFALPPFRVGSNTDNYLGVSSANSLLSPIKGTSLSLFGMHIDLADYVAAGITGEPSQMSHRVFMDCVLRRDQASKTGHTAEVPRDLSECETYATWYLGTVNSWLPVLHKPAYMDLIAKMYHEPTFKPTHAETVMVQMMLAIMKFQVATRNRDSGTAIGLHEQSNAHYHYALTLLHELVASHTLQDIQAMSVICIHLRGFPNPGAAWMLSSWTLDLAIEMGLHRSANVSPDNSKPDVFELETRKRVFWSLLTIVTTIGGKFGRPMPLRVEDFDVELPEPFSDNLPSEEGVSGVPKCSYLCGVEMFKLTEISLETYACIYAIRRRQNYEETVRSLERKAEAWKKQLPPMLTEGSDASKEPENRGFAVWMEYWEAEYQLLLHHPALCNSTSRAFIQRNLDICSKAASKLIRTVAQVHELNVLDITWNGTNTHIAAMFTLLFVYWERRDQITPSDLHKLKAELIICLDIIGYVSQLLGSATRLKMDVRQIVDEGLSQINRYLVQKTASAAVARAGLKRRATSPPSLQQASVPEMHDAMRIVAGSVGITSPDLRASQHVRHVYHAPEDQHHTAQAQAQAQVQFPDALQRPYPAPLAVSVNSYPYNSYAPETSHYNMPESTMNNLNHRAHNPDTYVYPPSSDDAYQPQPGPFGGASAWRQYTESMDVKDSYIDSASALMALGGRDLAQAEAGQSGLPIPEMANLPNLLPDVHMDPMPQQQPWPSGASNPGHQRGNQ